MKALQLIGHWGENSSDLLHNLLQYYPEKSGWVKTFNVAWTYLKVFSWSRLLREFALGITPPAFKGKSAAYSSTRNETHQSDKKKNLNVHL